MTGCGVVRSIEVNARCSATVSRRIAEGDETGHGPSSLSIQASGPVKSLADEAAAENGGADGAVLADFGLDLLTPKSLAELGLSLQGSVGFVAGDVSGRLRRSR